MQNGIETSHYIYVCIYIYIYIYIHIFILLLHELLCIYKKTNDRGQCNDRGLQNTKCKLMSPR